MNSTKSITDFATNNGGYYLPVELTTEEKLDLIQQFVNKHNEGGFLLRGSGQKNVEALYATDRKNGSNEIELLIAVNSDIQLEGYYVSVHRETAIGQMDFERKMKKPYVTLEDFAHYGTGDNEYRVSYKERIEFRQKLLHDFVKIYPLGKTNVRIDGDNGFVYKVVVEVTDWGVTHYLQLELNPYEPATNKIEHTILRDLKNFE